MYFTAACSKSQDEWLFAELIFSYLQNIFYHLYRSLITILLFLSDKVSDWSNLCMKHLILCECTCSVKRKARPDKESLTIISWSHVNKWILANCSHKWHKEWAVDGCHWFPTSFSLRMKGPKNPSWINTFLLNHLFKIWILLKVQWCYNSILLNISIIWGFWEEKMLRTKAYGDVVATEKCSSNPDLML